MDLIKGLTANYYINVAITAWFLAQLSKTLLTLVLKKACNGTNDRCRGNA